MFKVRNRKNAAGKVKETTSNGKQWVRTRSVESNAANQVSIDRTWQITKRKKAVRVVKGNDSHLEGRNLKPELITRNQRSQNRVPKQRIRSSEITTQKLQRNCYFQCWVDQRLEKTSRRTEKSTQRQREGTERVAKTGYKGFEPELESWQDSGGDEWVDPGAEEADCWVAYECD